MKFNHPSRLRVAFIDRQIRAGKYPNCQQVASEFEVDRKTIQRDIDNMRDLGAPIEYDKKRHGYYYTEPNYFFPSIQLTQSDMFAFVVNEQILKQYKDAPYYRDIKRVIEKIIQFLPDEIAAEETASIFSFQSAPASQINKHHFQLLQQAAYEEKQVKINYHSQHSNQASERVVDPYAIRNQQGTWYLIGLCHNRNEVRIFALNRILAITPTEVDFYKPTNFDIEEFLKESFST
ncbi:MAG: WYL domain-containing protein, partial [bacterium]|nr:WYL domain-containing protein [bacterium]